MKGTLKRTQPVLWQRVRSSLYCVLDFLTKSIKSVEETHRIVQE